MRGYPPDGWGVPENPGFDYDKTSNQLAPNGPGYFGTHAERGVGAPNPGWVGLKAAKRKAFRYCIVAQSQGSTTYSGLGEIHGNDFMITLGNWRADLRADWRVFAGTFMHELGHTLGLRHGGGDDVEYKPNYKSVMNYAWQVPICGYEADWAIDFSGYAANALNWCQISEAYQAGFAPGYFGRFPHSVVVSTDPGVRQGCDGGVQLPGFRVSDQEWVVFQLATFGSTSIDWNGDRQRTPGTFSMRPNWFELGQDISPCSLAGHVDWHNLQYSFRTSSDYPDGVHLTGLGMRELTLEFVQALEAIPAPCPADLDSDGSFANGGTPDAAVTIEDLLFMLAAFEAGDLQADVDDDGDPAAGMPDGAVTIDDLLFFLARFEQGC